MREIHQLLAGNGARHDGSSISRARCRAHHLEHVRFIRSIDTDVAGDEFGGVF